LVFSFSFSPLKSCICYFLLMITLKLYIRFHFSGYVILDTGLSLRTAQEPQDNPRKDLYDQS
jgi:hypothetical protein